MPPVFPWLLGADLCHSFSDVSFSERLNCCFDNRGLRTLVVGAECAQPVLGVVGNPNLFTGALELSQSPFLHGIHRFSPGCPADCRYRYVDTLKSHSAATAPCVLRSKHFKTLAFCVSKYVL